MAYNCREPWQGLSEIYNSLSNYSFKHIFYPKKDSFENSNAAINVRSINAFIDMDLIFYLNDILFCFELYDVYKQIEDKHFFGNLFDKHLERCENPLANNMLFDAYWPNYQKWKKTLTKNIDKKILKNATLVKLDFQRCFYQTRFNLEKLLNEYKISIDNPIVNIALNVYRYYSSKIYKLTGENKQVHYVQLVLGMPSSSILQNIMFSKFDSKMICNPNVIGYSRYVDDVLILINEEFDAMTSLKEFVQEIRKDDEEDNFKVNVNPDYLKPLILNQSKIEIKKGTSIDKINEQVEKIILPSMLDTVDEEASELTNELDSLEDLYSQAYIKGVINSYFENDIEPSKLVEFLNELSDADLLNIYSCWNKIISILKSVPNVLKEFKSRIIVAIKKIKYTNEDKFFDENMINDKEIKGTLMSQLEIALRLNEKNSYFLFNVSQDDIFKCIDNAYQKKIHMYFPVYVKLEYIELYMSIYHMNIEKLIDESVKLYEFINFIKLNDNHQARYTVISKLKDSDLKFDGDEKYAENEYSTLYSFSLSKKIYCCDDIKIGVMSVKMPEKTIEYNDIHCKYPETYSYKDIINNIKTAKKNNARYIVMPEFCIPNKHIIKVVNYCIKNEISLITGITHVFHEKEATNYVIIYDDFMKLVIAKPKNYYPYEERKLLAKNGYCPKVNYPFYIRIDNKVIHYSTMTCFEATNIRDRALLNNKIDTLFMPVYNRDTSYFSDIIGSLSRDLSCFVVQANNSEYGDSRISSPQDSIHKDIVKLKGGDNCFIVVGNIELKKLKDKHTFMEQIDKDISDLLNSNDIERDCKIIDEKIVSARKENTFKPLSAGSSLAMREKYTLIDKS